MVQLDEPLPLLLAVALGTLAVARVVRLVVDDTFPPLEALKVWWLSRADVKWHPLAECPWCLAPYAAGPAVLWFASLVARPTWTANAYLWWIVNGWAAVSWLAAWLCLRDVPPDQRE